MKIAYLFLALTFAIAQTALVPCTQAAIVYEYTGETFDITGAGGAGTGSIFSTADRVTGTAMFENIGDTTAQTVSLSTTGSPSFMLTMSDVDSFEWTGDVITGWNLSMTGDQVGSPLFSEEIFASSLAGDLVNFDFGGPGFDGASTFNAGQFTAVTAVPEPSSLLLLGGVAGAAIMRRRRRNSIQNRLA